MEKLKAILHYFQVVTDESESALNPLFTATSAEDAKFEAPPRSASPPDTLPTVLGCDHMSACRSQTGWTGDI